MWIPLAVAAGSAIVGAMGANKQAQAAKDAQKIRDNAAEKIYGIDAPDVSSLQYDPTTAQYTGDVNPTLQSNLGNITSASNDISADPRFQTAQYQALGSLNDIASSGGMTAADKLTAQNAMNSANMANTRQQGAITRDLAERGLGGSGQELALRLASNQTAANANSQAAQAQAASAQARALDAIKQQGTLGGSMQAAAYAQQNTAANAKDLIAKFNQQNAYNVQGANQTASNTAATNNQSQRQAVATNAANAANQAAQYNAGAVGTAFNQRLNQANSGAAASNGSAQSRSDAGAATAAQYGAIAGALPGVIKGATDAFGNKTADTTTKTAGDPTDTNTYA